MSIKDFFKKTIIGIIIICIGLGYFIYDISLKKRCSVETTAIVIDNIIKTKHNSDTEEDEDIYYYVLEYKVGEKTIKQTDKKGSSWPEYSVNEKVQIKYNPERIQEYIIKGQNKFKIYSMLLIAAGFFEIIYGVVKVDKDTK